jgi:hypothetical protein
MPWKECSVVEERLRFVARLLDGEAMTELCREFGISRKTVVWAKFCKLIMGSGEGPFPSEPPLARSPNLASEGGGEGRGRPFPLVDLSEPQAAVFNLSHCASLRNVMLR